MTTTLAAGERAAERSAARPGPGDRPGRDGPAARAHRRSRPSCTSGRPAPCPFGVVSSFQKMQPYPIYVSHGAGAATSGTRTAPSISTSTAASARWSSATPIRGSSRRSTRRPAAAPISPSPPRSAVAFGEEICRRFNLEMLRFANSGTEATMDAIRVARAATGRDVVCKIEGSYHGHHDSVMFSIVPNADLMGGRDRPGERARSRRGWSRTRRNTSRSCRSTTPTTSSACSQERGQEIACLIMEPAMMNIGIVVPQPGYLQRVRELCTKHGVVFIFDEIKTGFTIAAGGATERFGVQPDLVCLAKAISGGLPGRGIRRARGPHAAHRAGRVADGDLQRQPAGVPRRPGDAHRGADARRVPALRPARHPPGAGLPGRHRPPRHPRAHRGPGRQGLRLLPARRR